MVYYSLISSEIKVKEKDPRCSLSLQSISIDFNSQSTLNNRNEKERRMRNAIFAHCIPGAALCHPGNSTSSTTSNTVVMNHWNALDYLVPKLGR